MLFNQNLIKLAPIAHASLGFSGTFGFSASWGFYSGYEPDFTSRLPNRFPLAGYVLDYELIFILPKSPPPALDELFCYYMGTPVAPEDYPIKLKLLYYY